MKCVIANLDSFSCLSITKRFFFKQKQTKNIFQFSITVLGNVQITPALSSGATPAQTLVMATPTSKDLTGLTGLSQSGLNIKMP